MYVFIIGQGDFLMKLNKCIIVVKLLYVFKGGVNRLSFIGYSIINVFTVQNVVLILCFIKILC